MRPSLLASSRAGQRKICRRESQLMNRQLCVRPPSLGSHACQAVCSVHIRTVGPEGRTTFGPGTIQKFNLQRCLDEQYHQFEGGCSVVRFKNLPGLAVLYYTMSVGGSSLVASEHTMYSRSLFIEICSPGIEPRSSTCTDCWAVIGGKISGQESPEIGDHGKNQRARFHGSSHPTSTTTPLPHVFPLPQTPGRSAKANRGLLPRGFASSTPCQTKSATRRRVRLAGRSTILQDLSRRVKERLQISSVAGGPGALSPHGNMLPINGRPCTYCMYMVAVPRETNTCRPKLLLRIAHSGLKSPRANSCRSAELHVVEQLQWYARHVEGPASSTSPYRSSTIHLSGWPVQGRDVLFDFTRTTIVACCVSPCWPPRTQRKHAETRSV